jgi:hypothetical protein
MRIDNLTLEGLAKGIRRKGQFLENIYAATKIYGKGFFFD